MKIFNFLKIVSAQIRRIWGHGRAGGGRAKRFYISSVCINVREWREAQMNILSLENRIVKNSIRVYSYSFRCELSNFSIDIASPNDANVC